MTFFEQELRKIFASNPYFKDAVFTDKTVIAPLSEGRCFKLTLETSCISNCYDTLRLKVINTNQGTIDSQVFGFEDILDRVLKNDLNPDGKTAHIWVYDGKPQWYGVKDITGGERRRLADMVSDYLSIYQQQPTVDLDIDLDTEELTDEEEI